MARSKRNTRRPQSRSSTAPPNARPKPAAASDVFAVVDLDKALEQYGVANDAVTGSHFDKALEATGAMPPVAVAVSGGADSLALMLLAAAWCSRRRAAPPLALTVDHGLRKDSAREAQQVAHWALDRGIPHETLTWIGRKPSGNIQARAREARYRLLGERMRARGLTTLLTGHTRDDQAETLLLHLARGSGLDGLSGMAPLAPFPVAGFEDLRIARPLLAFSHSQLIRTLILSIQPWIEDPSNQDEAFARVKIRRALAALEPAGLTTERIASAAAHLGRVREAIDAAVVQLVERAAHLTPFGYALVEAERFRAAPREVALRTLARLIELIGGSAYPPRFEQTEAVLDWLVGRAAPAGRTLGGCRLARRDGRVLIAREEAALAKEAPNLVIEPGGEGLWDNRFWVAVPRSAKGAVEVRPLGAAGLKAAGDRARLPPVEPRRIAAALPALWRSNHLVSAPLIGFAGDEPAISARFVGFAGT